MITVREGCNLGMFKSSYNKRKEIWDVIESNRESNY